MIEFVKRSMYAHPTGRDRGGRHLTGNDFKFGRSRNHRRVFRVADPDGVVQTYLIFGRKGVKLNRLPRGSKRRTGVWNGQNVADMVAR